MILKLALMGSSKTTKNFLLSNSEEQLKVEQNSVGVLADLKL